MRFGATLPLDEMLESARAVEALGYRALWYPETPTTREALVQAALLLAATERLIVATGIANVWGARRDGEVERRRGRWPRRIRAGSCSAWGSPHAPLVIFRLHDYQRAALRSCAAYLDAMDAAPFTAAAPPSRHRASSRRSGIRKASSWRASAPGARIRTSCRPSTPCAPGAFSGLGQAARSRSRRWSASRPMSPPALAPSRGKLSCRDHLGLPNYVKNLAAIWGSASDDVRERPAKRSPWSTRSSRGAR